MNQCPSPTLKICVPLSLSNLFPIFTPLSLPNLTLLLIPPFCKSKSSYPITSISAITTVKPSPFFFSALASKTCLTSSLTARPVTSLPFSSISASPSSLTLSTSPTSSSSLPTLSSSSLSFLLSSSPLPSSFLPFSLLLLITLSWTLMTLNFLTPNWVFFFLISRLLLSGSTLKVIIRKMRNLGTFRSLKLIWLRFKLPSFKLWRQNQRKIVHHALKLANLRIICQLQESEEFQDLGHQKEEMKNLSQEDEDLVHQKEAKLEETELSKSEEETKGKIDKKLDGEGDQKKVLERMLQKDENEERKGKIGLRSGFKVMSKSQRLLEASLGSPENNWVYTESNYLGSFGSMRKEKEWRRTLACKLFEERHNNSNIITNNNINGSESEGMDSLWETYETESNKPKNNKKVLEKSKTKKSESKYYDPEEEDDEEDDEEEEEEAMDGKLCCLQALKFSAGKMNLGMGKPNLTKISKAFKGFGWLHHHVGRHGRKG